MSYFSDLFQSEIELAEDEGCIVFDFGCYFPYPGDQDRLNFSFSLGMTEFKDYKVNRRYPNKGYKTITRKYGRRLSKIGYPYVMKLTDYKEDEEQIFLLCIQIGVDGEEPWQLIFPVQTELTKEKPVCKLDFRFRFDKGEFYFESSARINEQHFSRMWLNYEPEYLQERNMEIYYFTHPEVEKPMLIYGEVIEPLAAAVENLYFY